jgi:hypothetical protein
MDKNINSLTVFHQNIQHFSSRKMALEIVIDELEPDILILSEHKLNENEIKFVKVGKYSVADSYCRQTCGGGGVMILNKDTIQVSKITIPAISNLCIDKEFECCMVACKYLELSFALLGLYRTPGNDYVSSFLDKLDKVIGILLESYEYIVIAGDINIDVLVPSKAFDNLSIILKQHNLYYLVNFPTRVTLNSQSAIDNILTNLPKNFLSIEGIITELSDHDAQQLTIHVKDRIDFKNRILTKNCRKFTNENIANFISMLQHETWVDLFNAKVEDKYDVFFEIFIYYFNICFPVVKSRVKCSHKKWITSDLVKYKEDIIDLSYIVRLTKDKGLKNLLKLKKKEYNAKLTYGKKMFVENKIKNSDNISKTTWSLINNEIKKDKVTNEIRLMYNGKEYKEPKSVSEVFNYFFVNFVDNKVIPNLSPYTPVNSSEVFGGRKFYAEPVSEEELEKIILSFPNKYSAGFDEIPMPVIKQARMFLLKPLAHIINSSFVSGIFPSKLKISKIITIHKKGDRTNPSNYRPVSIAPTISKIFERVIYLQLVTFLESNKLFDEEQHGFRRGKSVVSAAVDFLEDIIDAVDKGEHAAGIFMDLSKAFDSVSHNKLLESLREIGISNITLNWFSSYLSDRKQYVELEHIVNNKISHSKSSLLTVRHGVPQGSILGPILFLCYLRGMPSIVKSTQGKICLFADDSNLLVTGRTMPEIEAVAKSNLHKINNYFSSKNLLLNLEKTNLVCFKTKQNRNKICPIIKIDNLSISQISNTKFLGIHLDENLSFDSHILNLKKKIASGLFALKIMSRYCSVQILKSIYFAHIHSHIYFGVATYGATSNSNLNSILQLQKKAIRIIMNLENQQSAKRYFSELGILTVYGMYVLETIMLARCNGDRLSTVGSNHHYNTRNRNQLAIPKHSLKFFSKKPCIAGIKFMRHIPKEILAIKENSSFKKKLKSFLIMKTLYKFDELGESAF